MIPVLGASVLGLGLVGVPARLTEGCGRWIAIAVVLEVLSAAGFVVFFTLVFGGGSMGWAGSVPAALRALSSRALLPAGGLIGPTIGIRSADAKTR